MRWLFIRLVVTLLLSGCAATSQRSASIEPVDVLDDPQQCLSRAECSLKLSRTLLFVLDYAAAGAPLVQRDGRLLFTPADAPLSDWPALYIRLAEPQQSRFDFNAQCRLPACRLEVEQLLQVYRSYLVGRPCTFSATPCRLD